MSDGEHIYEEGLSNNEVSEQHFEQVQDFGNVLKLLRLNQGYTIETLSKKLSITPQKIGQIERSLSEIPDEFSLRRWLKALGCKDNVNKLIELSRRHRVSHTIRLHSKEECNADMIRLLDKYRAKELTDFDKALLSLIGR